MLKEKVKTAGRFCTVGVGNTLIDFGVFFLLAACHVPYLPAQICSYSAGSSTAMYGTGSGRFV